MEFDLSGHGLTEQAQLWVPYPVSNTNQLVTNIQISGDYESAAVYTDQVFATPMLHARWAAGQAGRQLTLRFDVSRKELRRPDLSSPETAWDPADYALYLRPTSLGPIDGEVKKLADQITLGKTTVLAKAKAIYDWACENTYRNPATRGCGAGDVCKLLQDPGGKCADISSLYVALARAAGVPAREILGLRQGKKSGDDITTWQHCWAEFYLPGHGWLPVDPADVRKMMLVEKLELSDAKTASYRDYYWGGLDAYRIKLGEGKDLTLNPPQAGEALNYLMYPFAQIGTTTLDWLDPATFRYKISYEKKQ
jgi:transglutaminase-like putative cysteine protease